MGGCYDSRYYSDCQPRQPAVQRDPIETLLKKFLRAGDRKVLCEAYRQYAVNNSKGFIKKLADCSGTEIAKELPDYEYEAKLELSAGKIGGKGRKGGMSLADLMDVFEFTPSPVARFLKDASNLESTGDNHFFGTDEGEERLVVIKKFGKWYLKEKGPREELHYGIPGEELVYKRRERRVETNPLEIGQLMAERYGDGKTRYQGKLTKNRAEAHLLQTITGRIYSLTVDELLREDAGGAGKQVQRLVQFEVEYAGYIPAFRGINDAEREESDGGGKHNEKHKEKLQEAERAIVGDIVQVLKHVIFLCNDLELPSGERLLIQPTQERKFDFARAGKLLERGMVPVRTLARRKA